VLFCAVGAMQQGAALLSHIYFGPVWHMRGLCWLWQAGMAEPYLLKAWSRRARQPKYLQSTTSCDLANVLQLYTAAAHL
jgi:hypothetical protein